MKLRRVTSCAVGRTKAGVGSGVGAITAGKGPAELSSQDGGPWESGDEGDLGQGEDRGWGVEKAVDVGTLRFWKVGCGVGRSKVLPREASPPLQIGVCKAGMEARGVGPRVLTNPFFSEQCDFTEDQTAGRQSLTRS